MPSCAQDLFHLQPVLREFVDRSWQNFTKPVVSFESAGTARLLSWSLKVVWGPIDLIHFEWRTELKLNIITLAIIALGIVLFLWHAVQLPWTPYRIAGFAIAIPALLLLVLARIQLGRAFSLRAKASNLVTTGLYSHIRNPIYVFGALIFLGIIIWTGRPWLLLILAVLVPMQIYRARQESKVLEARFGAEYLEYKRKTWF